MKIGIDCRLWNESGVGRYARNLVKNLQALDKTNEYVLFALSKDADQIQFEISNLKFKIVKADIQWHSIAEQVRFVQILNKEHLDLVHFPYFSVPVFYRKPFVVTIHDLIVNRYPTGKASTLPAPLYWAKHIGYQFVIAQAISRAQKIITVSMSTKKEIEEQFSTNDSKIEVIYEGVDNAVKSSKFSIRQAQDKKVQSLDEKFFLYVGNAYPHKNLDVLIQSFKKLQEDHKDISLVLVGKEDHFYKKLKEKIKKEGFDTKIIFYGFATDEELGSLYASALAFVFPSKMEGFGLPLLEAMANNCLVIASDIPIFREIARDGVLYFNPESPSDLLQNMKKVLSSGDKYSDLLKKGLAISKEYSWKKMAQQTLTVYNSSL